MSRPLESGLYVGVAPYVLSLGNVPDPSAQVKFSRRLDVLNNRIYSAGIEVQGDTYVLSIPSVQTGIIVRVIPAGTPRQGSWGYCETVDNIFGEGGQQVVPFLIAQGRIDRGAAKGVSHCVDALYYMPPESALMLRQEGQSFVTHVLKAFVDPKGDIFPLLQAIAPSAS